MRASAEGAGDGFRVLHLGNGWAAVDKPVGMTAHNEPGRDLCSRMEAWLSEHPDEARRMDWTAGSKVHPVHRLDRDTSGVVLLALRSGRVRELSERLAAPDAVKRYRALLHGPVAAPAGAVLQWEWPLSKRPGGRDRPAGPPPRAACRTECVVLDHGRRYTLVEARPLTGRRHQIRRHAKIAGHPVVGDARYGSRRSLRFLRGSGFHRLALHAASLTLTPPGENGPLRIDTDPLPPEIQRLFDDDR